MRRTAYPAILTLTMHVAVPPAVDAQQVPDVTPPAPYIDTVGGLGVDDAIALAREREPGLRATRSDVEAARGRRQQSELRPNPTTTFEGRREPGGTDSLMAIGVQWPLDLFRRDGRIGTATQQVTASELAVVDRDRILAGDVRLHYGRAAAAIREAQIATDLASTVERQLGVVRVRASEGAAPRLESDLLEVELRRLQAERELADGRAERAVLALKPLLGMSPGDALALREPIDVLVATRAAAPTAWVATQTLTERADVRAAAQQVAAAGAAADQARRDGRFDVGLFASYMRMDSGFPQLGLGASGLPERVRGQFGYVSGGVMVMVPLLNRNQGQIAAAVADRAAAEARRVGVHLAAAAEVAQAAARDRRARQAVTAYADTTRALARRNLDVVSQTFELGRATVFDVLAEQRRYLEFERAYTATLLEAWEAHADLRRALGEQK